VALTLVYSGTDKIKHIEQPLMLIMASNCQWRHDAN